MASSPGPDGGTPSFNVSPNLGIYKCFGCGEAGDSITFLQKHEHLSYVEAIRWLAKRYAIDLPEEEQTPEQQLEHSERESLAVADIAAGRTGAVILDALDLLGGGTAIDPAALDSALFALNAAGQRDAARAVALQTLLLSGDD